MLIEGMIQSLDLCQQAYARALLIDRDAIDEAQEAGDVVGAEQIILDAFRTDVTPIIAAARIEMGLHPDPIKAHREACAFVDQVYGAEVKRDGGIYAQSYERGLPLAKLKQVGKTKKTGTKVTFWADDESSRRPSLTSRSSPSAFVS
jgi:hypothetical protein